MIRNKALAMRPRAVFGVPPRVELIPGGAKTFLWPLCDRVGRDGTSGLRR